MKPRTKESLLGEIESLKRNKPENWKRDAKRIFRMLQNLTFEEDYRETMPNGDIRGYEFLGRKCRSTKIQPPI